MNDGVIIWTLKGNRCTQADATILHGQELMVSPVREEHRDKCSIQNRCSKQASAPAVTRYQERDQEWTPLLETNVFLKHFLTDEDVSVLQYEEREFLHFIKRKVGDNRCWS
ncbi:Fibroleukin [Manis javanica]|nr:Fibroleukin [Manis javanica]